MKKTRNNNQNIKWGLTQIMFAFKFYNLCKTNKIQAGLFVPKLTAQINKDIVYIPKWDAFDQKGLIKQSEDLLMISLGVCAITINDALEKKYDRSSYSGWKNNPSDLNTARELIHLIRCAYAHRMPDIHWNITKERRCVEYVLNSKFRFNTVDRHKTKLSIEDFGGFNNFIYLIDFISQYLE